LALGDHRLAGVNGPATVAPFRVGLGDTRDLDGLDGRRVEEGGRVGASELIAEAIEQGEVDRGDFLGEAVSALGVEVRPEVQQMLLTVSGQQVAEGG